LRVADLICIGSQKAATTWLHRMLAGHPNVFMPVFKEIHYFDALHIPSQKSVLVRRKLRSRRLLFEQIERSPVHRLFSFVAADVVQHRVFRRYLAELRAATSLDCSAIDDSWYARFFEEAGPSSIACDFTATYALLPPEGIAHLRRLNHQARIIYIVRNPVERALSHARMLLVRNRAPRTIESLRSFVDHDRVRMHDDCVEIIDRWREHWPSDQFHVVFHDQIAATPLQVLEETCAFAGIPFDPEWFPHHGKVIYRGPRIRANDEIRAMLEDRYASLIESVRERFPIQAAKW
jgi:hypothetical protein